MPKPRLNVESVKQRVFEKFNGKYEFVNFKEYSHAKQKEEIKCNECGEIFVTSISALIFENHTCYCPKCKKENRKKEFVQKVLLETNNEYIPISEYDTCKDKVLFRHNKSDCMNEFWMTPDTFFNGGSRCPICMHRQGADKLFISQEEFENKVKDIHKDNIKIIGKYRGYKEKVKIQHTPCGRIFDTYAGDLLQGKSCRYCAGKMLKNTEEFKQDLFNLYGDEYTLIGEYKNAKTKVHIKHNLCGYEWDIIPRSIMVKRTCPHCNKSFGEKELENFAIHNNLNYKTQETFKGCYRNDYLKFDMSIYDKKDKLLCLVEFDGSSHFQPTYFGNVTEEQAIKALEDQQERDRIKNDYCMKNNISLLRLSDKTSICSELKEYLYKNFDMVTEIPNVYHYDKMKTPAIKFLDMLKELPNGIYPKTFFSDKLLSESQKLSVFCLNQEVVKEYMEQNNILNHSLYIEINCNEDDYSQYIKIGLENNFDFEVFRNVKNLYHLPNGKYTKVNAGYKNRATTKCDGYEFFNRFIESQNITFTTLNLYKNKREVA